MCEIITSNILDAVRGPCGDAKRGDDRAMWVRQLMSARAGTESEVCQKSVYCRHSVVHRANGRLEGADRWALVWVRGGVDAAGAGIDSEAEAILA